MKALEDHQSSIIILTMEWSMRKRDMAAPECMDLLLMSRGSDPKVVAPPNKSQTCRRRCPMKELVMSRGLSMGVVVQMGVESEAVGAQW